MAIELKKRDEISQDFKWRITDLFENDGLWQKEFDAVSERVEDFNEFQGKLTSAENLLECLRIRDEISIRAGRVYVYANMKLHEDSTSTFYQGLTDKCDGLLTRLSAAGSFIEPEILALSEEDLERFTADNNDLKKYGHYLDNLTRLREHILSPELERLMAEAQEIGLAADNIYSMIHDADMKFGSVINDDGVEVEVTHGKFISLMESRKQEVREKAFGVYYDTYIKQKNTLAATLNASIKKDVFFSRARKYSSALAAALSGYNIPEPVYENLIEAVHGALPQMHRYVKLRKKLLGLSELHMYDLYTPVVPEANTKVSFEEAKTTVLKSLAPLGQDYVSVVEGAFKNGWLDVYENAGKRSGAYSWGAYGCHPYVLLNYDNKLNDMFTLAHEMGHAMHSNYSWDTQDYIYSDYTIFVAEVASTVNEALLMDYLLKNTTDPVMKKYLVNYYLEQFRGTLFRQTMFAEFEKITHHMVEGGEPLTVQTLCEVYRELNKKYYGDEIILDPQIDMEWSRIPHFYSAFYVYQYATGYSAATALSRRILTGGRDAADAYIEFLKSGSSDYSINLLAKAGVDMSRKEPVMDALKVFEGLLNEMEAL